MPVTTTVIGSMPKPEYLKIPDWFKTGTSTAASQATDEYGKLLEGTRKEDQQLLERDCMRATYEVIGVQCDCGVHVVTDGEVRRENYIHYLCRFIDGIDFVNLTEMSVRDGAYIAKMPTVVGKVKWRGPLDCAAEWQKAQHAASPTDVKYTLPGPMTIIGSTHNSFYGSEKELAADLAEIVNFHVRALAAAGCRYIQVDEPLFARHPEKALDWGFEMLERCFAGIGVDGSVERQVHMCCGYPNHLDQTDYKKADPDAYAKLADAIEASCIDAISLEDAHRQIDISLLRKFKKTKVILGVVQIASSRVETVAEIESRLTAALEHIDASRLIAAPDCGLGLLPGPLLQQKLGNMCEAARRVGGNGEAEAKRRRIDDASA